MSDIVVYDSGEIELKIALKNETLWLNQKQIVELFDKNQSVISRHIGNIFKDDEVDKKSNMQKMHIANSDKPVNTKTTSKQLQLDSKKYQAQYNNLKIKKSNNYHDRILIIDKTQAYHIGASLKDLGKKVFAFSKIDSDLLRWVD